MRKQPTGPPIEPAPAGSADNALRLVLPLSQRQRVRVTDAAAHLGVAHSTAHRLLRTLSRSGFAEQDAHKAYRPDPAYRRIVLTRQSTHDPLDRLHRHLVRLHDELGETCHPMVLEGNGTRFVDCVECGHVLRIGSRAGLLLPAHCTSGGKALLAELSAQELDGLYPRDLPAAPGAPPVQRAALRRSLAAVRRRGYATNIEESDRGVIAAGACVRDRAGPAVAAFAVAAAASADL